MNPGGAGVRFDHFHSEYDEMLARGLALSGENRLYFARGRAAFLARCLREAGLPSPSSLLDLGCGTGAATPYFFEELGVERVVGVDVSERSLEIARARHASDRTRFVTLHDFCPAGEFQLAFCNGVFHHVPPDERARLVALLRDSLSPGGLFALWENNPWNPGTRYVMSRIAFDRDAVTLSSREATRMVVAAGLAVLRTDYLFVFPRVLKALRFLELPLSKLPLGGQYQVLSRRPATQSTRFGTASSPRATE
jgi:trans-aconitate methyltransferase